MSWTPEREQLLAVLWAQGLSASLIAKRVSALPGPPVSKSAIIGKKDRLGLPARETAHSYRSGGPRPKTITKIIKPKAPKPVKVATPPAHRQLGAERGDWNIPHSKSSDRFHCQRFVAEESGVDGLVCGRPKTHGSWCAECKRDVFQPLRLADAA